MKKLAFLLGISLMILLMGQAKAYTQDLYYYNTTAATDFNNTIYINATSDLETCNTTIDVYTDITGVSGTFINYYVYEGTTQLGSTAQITSSNVSCVHVATRTASSSDTNITARFLNIGTPANVTLYTEIHTTCGLVTNATIFLTTSNGLLPTPYKTNNGYLQHFPFNFSLYTNSTIIQGAIDAWNSLPPTHCVKTSKEVPTGYVTLYNTTIQYFFVPFNSGIGIANITGAFHSSGFGNNIIGLLNLNSNSGNILSFYSGGGNYFSHLNHMLQPATDYVLWVAYVQTVFTPTNLIPPNMNITLTDYEPNYNCTAWSSCSSGQQTRTCTDLGGLAPEQIQTRSCLAVNQTAVLGFENYYVPSDRYICQPNLFPLCSLLGNIIANVTVLFPDNPRWAIVPDSIYYYITTITSETATLGSRSLKLWYIPQSPYSDQPFNNSGTPACGNTTTGTFPEIFRVINTSFMASLDFTFPAGTTELRFDVKRCDTNVVQYDGWCGKRCYAQNCTIPPSGDFIAALYDQVEDTNLFELSKEATTNWTTYTAFIGSNAIEDRNYTLIFSVLPLPINPTETQGNCVYFDNVRLINTAISIYDEWADNIYGTTWSDLSSDEKQTVLLEKCVNQCIGNNYYIRTIQDLTCMEEVVLNYSTCVTQYQQQQTGNQSIFLPISSIANTIVNTTTNQTFSQSMIASGFGFVLVFLTPVFWLFLIIIVVMMVASYYTKHMEIGGVAGLLLLVAFTIYFQELIWITIIMVIISAYLIGRQVVKVVQGG